MQSRARGSSSTISTRTVPTAGETGAVTTLGTDGDISILDIRVERQQHPRSDATAWYVGDIQGCRLGAVQLRQPRSGVRQPDALARRSAIDRTEPVAAIPHREFDVQPRSTRGYAKQRGSWASGDAVAKCVLDQRLQDEWRHERG